MRADMRPFVAILTSCISFSLALPGSIKLYISVQHDPWVNLLQSKQKK